MKYCSVLCLAAIVLILAIPNPGYSQNDDKDGRSHSLKPGEWALQFQITDDFGLKPFNGMSLSVKRHISSKSAFRLGVNADLRYTDSDEEGFRAIDDTLSYDRLETVSDNSLSLQFDLLYLNYPNAGANINWYWGIGPLVRLSRANREMTYSVTDQSATQKTYNKYETNSWQIGVLGALGVEWFATEGISFHAEYRAYGAYESASRESSVETQDGVIRKDTSDDDSWVFNGGQTIFGVSLYF